MIFRKIKDARKVNKGNTTARTAVQIHSAVKTMIFRNPMKNKSNRLKQTTRAIFKRTGRAFEKKNLYWKLRKNYRHSERTKTLISIMLCGHKPYALQRVIASQLMLNNNPMKNPIFVLKWKESRKNNLNAVSLPEQQPSL